MSGHTPGPWSVGAEDADSGEIEVISEARPYVCMSPSMRWDHSRHWSARADADRTLNHILGSLADDADA